MQQILCLTIFLIFSCGKKKEEDKTTTELEGTWKGNCVSSTSASSNSTYIFTNDTFSTTTISYSDTACATKAITTASSGTFSIGE